MLNVLYKSIFSPLGVFHRDSVKGRLGASVATVLLTAFLGSVVTPVASYYANRSRYGINVDISGMVLGFILSIITWLAACTLLWLLSKAFKKGLTFGQVASTWGLSYIPNFLCVVLYGLLLTLPNAHSANGFAAFLLCALFIMLLVWKAIYYFMFLRFVIDTTLGEFLICTAASAIVFAALMFLGFKAGIQVPML